MAKNLLAILLLTISLNADISKLPQNNSYLCIAYQKISDDKIQRLDMKQSVKKGGYFELSLQVNFLNAIVSRKKNEIENLEYPKMKFSYIMTSGNYDFYGYDYNKMILFIERNNIKTPSTTILLKNKDKIMYKCMMYKQKQFYEKVK